MFYAVDFIKAQAWEAASPIAWRDPSEDVREEPGYIGVLQQNQVVGTSKGNC